MIKKITEKEYDVRCMKYAMMFGLGSIAFILMILSVCGTISFIGSEILFAGVYGLPVAILGIIFGSELEHQRQHPERFVYCKKCKKIIRKKDKFCSNCRNDIKKSLNEVDNRKHIKDYKKFYKGKKK